MKKKIGYVIIFVSFLLIVLINHFFERYKAFSIILFIFMVIGGQFIKKED